MKTNYMACKMVIARITSFSSSLVLPMMSHSSVRANDSVIQRGAEMVAKLPMRILAPSRKSLLLSRFSACSLVSYSCPFYLISMFNLFLQKMRLSRKKKFDMATEMISMISSRTHTCNLYISGESFMGVDAPVTV